MTAGSAVCYCSQCPKCKNKSVVSLRKRVDCQSMKFMLEWWNKSDKTERNIQALAFLLTLAICTYQSAFVSIAMGLAGAYIIADCIKKKSIRGFASNRECWLGIAVFLATVMLSSLMLGDGESIHIAFKYVYWSLPFFLIIYFKKQADVKYAVLLGVCICILLDGIYTAYQSYLIQQGAQIGMDGRIELFYGHPNHYAMFLIIMLPILMFSLQDDKLHKIKRFIYADIFLIGLGLWSLIKAGSRGAFGGLAIGFFFIVLLYCYQKKSVKKFLAGLMVCVSVSGLMSAFMAGGMQRHYDTERLLLFQSSYAMWQDHKLLGVGLNNWAKEYQQKYMMENATERNLEVPHNTIAWFFTTTGVIGGTGYLFFVLYYTVLLCRKICSWDLRYTVPIQKMLLINKEILYNHIIILYYIFRRRSCGWQKA